MTTSGNILLLFSMLRIELAWATMLILVFLVPCWAQRAVIGPILMYISCCFELVIVSNLTRLVL